MPRLLNARVPAVTLPPALAGESRPTDHLEPTRRVDIVAEGGLITHVAPAESARAEPEDHDAAGSVVWPGLVDCHTHLDKAHTWDRAPNPRGEFWDACHALGADAAHWTLEDISRRARFALRSAWAYGTTALRTHVDTGGSKGDAGHEVMAGLRAEWAGRIALQTVALCGLDDLEGSSGRTLIRLTSRWNVDALGGFPQPNPDLPRQLDQLLTIADDLGKGIDLHVDESSLVGAECLRATAEAVLRRGFRRPVACGHCCSLAVQDPARARETIALVREAGIRVISLPLCNAYLQGRRWEGTAPRTPSWRGLTLLHELLEAGVPVAAASDNIRDAFHAFGDLDALEVYHTTLRLGHLDTRLFASPAVVTTHAADVMGLPGHGRIAPGSPASLIVTETGSWSEFVARPQARRAIWTGDGPPVARPLPSYRELTLP